MPKLLIYHNDELDSEIELSGKTLRLGRSADNDVVLADPVKTLSRRHAQLVFEQGTYTVVDQNSQNGIWAAGVRVPSAPLKAGAPVVMGAYKLLLKPDMVVSTGDETMLIPRGGLDLKAADPFATVFIAKPEIPPAGAAAAAGGSKPTAEQARPGEATEIRPIVVPPQKTDAKAEAPAPKAAAEPPAAKPAAPANAAATGEPKPAAAPVAKAEPPKPDAKPAAAAAAPKAEAKPAAAAAPAPAPAAPPKPAAPPAPAPVAAKPPEPAKPAAKPPEPAKPAAKKGDAGGSKAKYIAAAAVLLLALGGGGYYMFGRPPAPETQTASVQSEPAPAPAPAAKAPEPAQPAPAPVQPAPVAKAPVRVPKVTGELKEPAVKPVKKDEPPARPTPEPVLPPPPPPPPVDPQTLFEKARSAMIAGDYLAAVSGFEQVLKLDSNYPNAANLLGVARGGAKNAAQLAIDAGNKAEMTGDYAGARKQYDRAAELDPGAPAVASAIRRLIARMQGAGEAAFKAARQYDATNKTKEAIASYESALQLLPANHESVPVARERLAALKGGA